MKKIIILLIIIFGITEVSIVLAQNKRLSPSERRKETTEKSSKEKIYGDDDPDFSVTDIPDKWKNESAVVICQKMDYSFLRDNEYNIYDEVVRRRVKLLDNAAVESFSEFYYINRNEQSVIGIKIIKQDGTILDVSTKDAVEVDSDIPNFYRSYSIEFLKYKKIAIPNLEVGDIIDYFFKNKVETVTTLFPALKFTMSSTYSIMAQKIRFTVDKGFYLNFNSYLGAPEIKTGEPGKDLRGRVRGTIRTYILDDKDREKLSDAIWTYRYRTVPYIKFRVSYVPKILASSVNEFLSEDDVAIKKTVTRDEIQEMVNDIVVENWSIIKKDANEIRGYLKKNAKSSKPIDIARMAYYYYRFMFLDDYYQYAIEPQDFVTVNNYRFVGVLSEVLKDQDIPSEVVVGVPRYSGTLDDVLFTNELSLGLKVDGDKGFYIFPFNNFSTFEMTDQDLDGTDVLVFKLEKGRDLPPARVESLPASSSELNKFVCKIDVTIDENFENLKFKRHNDIAGLFKPDFSGVMLSCKDYRKLDLQKFDKYYTEEKTKGNSKRVAEEKRKETSTKKEKEKEQLDKLKEWVEKEFDVVSFDSFELLEDGRFDESSHLIFDENFVVKNAVNKAGRNYMLDAGKLAGSQFELKEKDMKRTTDAFINFAKCLTNEISVTIPEGYIVENVNELNFNVDNDCGSFISSAKVVGNKLIITTSKTYKINLVPKENWPKVVDFLETAYKFSQKKVLLKKA